MISLNSYVDEGIKGHNEQPALSEGNAWRLRATDIETSSSVRCRNLLDLGKERLWLRQGVFHCHGKVDFWILEINVRTKYFINKWNTDKLPFRQLITHGRITPTDWQRVSAKNTHVSNSYKLLQSNCLSTGRLLQFHNWMKHKYNAVTMTCLCDNMSLSEWQNRVFPIAVASERWFKTQWRLLNRRNWRFVYYFSLVKVSLKLFLMIPFTLFPGLGVVE